MSESKEGRERARDGHRRQREYIGDEKKGEREKRTTKGELDCETWWFIYVDALGDAESVVVEADERGEREEWREGSEGGKG